jgi:hypothetical protein
VPRLEYKAVSWAKVVIMHIKQAGISECSCLS